ncbi:hypothetical protein HHI36_007530 [Cryptolaemus montrouzieri]|uniref:Peptidase metallopeptidase domain-containing protein n=1 Tax=Cryptolaemus montrouzieri TaxID=559131 RepID=A0ABD2MQC6_9CUCU
MESWLILVLIPFIGCSPIGNKVEPTPLKVLGFMKQFGYLAKDKETSAALYTEEGLSETIKAVQKFGAIEETGKLDNATLKLMASPRCGNPDVIQRKRSKRFTFGSNGWNKKHITFYVANWSSRLGEEKVSRLIEKALKTWGSYGGLTFTKKTTPDADIIVSFARGAHNDPFPFDGPGYVLAHAYFPNDGSELSGDIHFDDDEEWVDSTLNELLDSGTDFYTVALHELGHSLGLGHSNDPNAIMFPYYKGDDESSLQLGHDDILAMYQLYIARPITETTTIATSPPRRTSPPYTRPTTEASRTDNSKTRYHSTTLSTSSNFEPSSTRRTTESIPWSTTRLQRYPDSDKYASTNTNWYTSSTSRTPSTKEYPYTESNTPRTYSTKEYIYTDSNSPRTSNTKEYPNTRRTSTKQGYPYTESNPPRTFSTNENSNTASNNRFPYFTTKDFSSQTEEHGGPKITVTISRTPYNTQASNLPTTRISTPPPVPDICRGNVDAVANLREEMFIFKDQYVWRFQDRNRMMPGYPILFQQMFPVFPEDIQKIDAAYQRPDGNMIFFNVDQYWVYDGSILIEHSPRPISDYGIPIGIGGIDAVQTWRKNEKTYLYKGDRFWKYNENNKTVDPGYPAHIERWRGIPEDLDAAMTWKDGKTYFFKGNQYWTFNNEWIIVSDSSPRSFSKDWLGCS